MRVKRGGEMKHCDFEVLKDGTVIVAKRSIVLLELAAVWSNIVELAKAVEKPRTQHPIQRSNWQDCYSCGRRYRTPLR